MADIGLYEAMSTLRAVRRLRPDPIPETTLRRVVEAARDAQTVTEVAPAEQEHVNSRRRCDFV